PALHGQQPPPVAEERAHARRRRPLLRRAGAGAAQDDGRERHPVPVRRLPRLRPRPRPGDDPRAPRRHQLRRRRGEPAGARDPGAGDPPRAARARGAAAHLRSDAGPWHPLLARDLAGPPGRAAARIGPPGERLARTVSAVLLVAAILGGVAATYYVDEDARLPARFAMGVPLGIVGWGLVGYVLGWAFGLSMGTATVAAAIVLMGPLWMLRRRGGLSAIREDLAYARHDTAGAIRNPRRGTIV